MPPRHRSESYEYEVEVRQSNRTGRECPEMPHDETVRVMIMDGIGNPEAMRFRFMSDEML